MRGERQFLLLYTSFPDQHIAKQIAHALLEQRLAACVNLLPEVTSFYRWQGELCEGVEVAAIIKTDAACWDGIQAVFAEMHPYQTPVLVALDVARAPEAIKAWVASSLALAEE